LKLELIYIMSIFYISQQYILLLYTGYFVFLTLLIARARTGIEFFQHVLSRSNILDDTKGAANIFVISPMKDFTKTSIGSIPGI